MEVRFKNFIFNINNFFSENPGPPVTVGVTISINSINSVSEVNIVILW